MKAEFERSIVWFRRDLRLADHVALTRAAACSRSVVCAFVVDPELLRSGRMGAPIVQFFFDSLAELRAALRRRGSDLVVLRGDPVPTLGRLAARLGAGAVLYNEDYEPDARRRDLAVERALEADGRTVRHWTDQVYFAPDEVVQASGKPYVVYSPYRRRWMERLAADPRPTLPSFERRTCYLPASDIGTAGELPTPHEFGFERSEQFPAAGERSARALLTTFVEDGIARYADDRNAPGTNGTSRLSPHLRAGTIGIRTCVAAALDAAHGGGGRHGADTWLGELIWRDFYYQILAHFPGVASGPFIAAARDIVWRDDDDGFAAWCKGRTGYPIVDAAMRQLNAGGWIHNRLRMIVASFLTKDLLIDWRRGERYFEQHLADADLAANNGGWQWSASTGTDPVPYFRIFSPVVQGKTFDPDGAFVRAMLPELERVPKRYLHEPWTMPAEIARAAGVTIGENYPAPIVDHAAARARALAAYAAALGPRGHSR